MFPVKSLAVGMLSCFKDEAGRMEEHPLTLSLFGICSFQHFQKLVCLSPCESCLIQ